MNSSVSIIDLPLPPSVNHLFANAGKKGRVITPRYKAWRDEAGWSLLRQRPGSVSGRYSLEVYIQADAKADLGNLEKALSDLLVSHRVVEDDIQAWAIHLYRDPRLTKGCRLVVRAILPEEMEQAA